MYVHSFEFEISAGVHVSNDLEVRFKISNTSCLQKGSDKQCKPRSDCFWRSSLIWVFSVWYSDKRFVNSTPENQQFIWEQKEKKVFESLEH